MGYNILDYLRFLSKLIKLERDFLMKSIRQLKIY